MKNITLDLKHVYSTERDSLGFASYMINYVPHNNRLVGLYRKGGRTKSCYKAKGELARADGVHKIEFIREGDKLKKTADLSIADMLCEDPRVFLYNNLPHGIFWTGHNGNFYLIDIENHKINELKTDSIKKNGKNWGSIVLNEELHIVYRVHPLIIYRYKASNHSLELSHKIEYSGAPIRGGTSFVRHHSAWYAVAHHTHSPHHHTAVLVKIDPDFKKITQTPLVSTKPLYQKGVLDPLGIYIEESSESIVFICHWGPSHASRAPFFHVLEGRIPFSLLNS